MEADSDKNGEVVPGAAEGDANGKKQQTDTKQEGMVDAEISLVIM